MSGLTRTDSTPFSVRLPNEVHEAIHDYIPNPAEWARRLLEAGLDARLARDARTQHVYTDGTGRTLSPTQSAVYSLLRGHPDGVCRRDFALHDVWEVSNRIAEIEERLDVVIGRSRCRRHEHRHAVTLYRLP